MTRTCFLSHAWSELRLCSANHRTGYWSNLPCDWPSTAWAYSEQETENGPWVPSQTNLYAMNALNLQAGQTRVVSRCRTRRLGNGAEGTQNLSKRTRCSLEQKEMKQWIENELKSNKVRWRWKSTVVMKLFYRYWWHLRLSLWPAVIIQERDSLNFSKWVFVRCAKFTGTAVCMVMGVQYDFC